VYQFFLNYIPCAHPLQSYILSNNDTISVLVYILATTPEYSHSWVVFKALQEDMLRPDGGDGMSQAQTLLAFPPPPFLTDISKTVVEFWKVLEPSEIMEWEELARDIRIAHAQLVATFGNGAVFEGKDWEDHRHYHARTLYWKWVGLQVIHGTTQTNESSLAFVSPYAVQPVSTMRIGLRRFV
jgi:hypothetical protein